ncbi:MAG TPA: hypothetical protein VKD72_14045 [Gemmataceae bacterium]|nr:hypothetical protein [Gemmataceae bacterium]
MRLFLPEFEGRLATPVPHDFGSRLAGRVRSGLLVPGKRQRANYTVDGEGRDRVSFRAADLATAVAVGLNEVVVERLDNGTLTYRVQYWTWTRYCVVLGASLFLIFLLGGIFWGEQISAQPLGPGLFWAHATFWCFAWPWILTALHKRSASRCLERILREVLQAPGS